MLDWHDSGCFPNYYTSPVNHPSLCLRRIKRLTTDSSTAFRSHFYPNSCSIPKEKTHKAWLNLLTTQVSQLVAHKQTKQTKKKNRKTAKNTRVKELRVLAEAVQRV